MKLESTWGRVKPLRAQRRALLVALVGIVSSLAAAAWLRASEIKESRAVFERRTREMQLAIRTRFAAPLSTLHAVPLFFAASNAVEAREFAAFVRSALARERGLASIAWAPELLDAERAAFERSANALDWPGFAVT